MLVLSRKRDEAIYVYGPCVIRIVEVRQNGFVKVGLVGEKGTLILREELAQEEGREPPVKK